MSTLNVSLPEYLKNWVKAQVSRGSYTSASDYLRDLVRNDMRQQQGGEIWLKDHLTALLDTPASDFVTVTAKEIKATAEMRLQQRKG